MRICSRHSFYKYWNRWITCKKGSPVAVLLCPAEELWNGLSEELRLALQQRYPVKTFLCGMSESRQAENRQTEYGMSESRQAEYSLWDKRQLREIQEWEPRLLVGVGDFHFLQEVCRLRQDLQEQPGRKQEVEGISLVLFPVQDCQRMLSKKVLWIRDREGNTRCLRYLVREHQDMLVLPEQRCSASLQSFRKLLDLWEKAFLQEFAELGDCPPPEGEAPVRERLLWEELAEPLFLRYGIPLWIGLYYAYLYLYRIAEKEVQQRLDSLLCDLEPRHADWLLEEAAEQYCSPAVEAVWLPKGDVELLAEMAMTGIEMLPEQKLSWQQVKQFYRSLCR